MSSSHAAVPSPSKANQPALPDPARNPTYPQRTHFGEKQALETELHAWNDKIRLVAQQLMSKDGQSRSEDLKRLYHQMMGAQDQMTEAVRRIPLETGALYHEDLERLRGRASCAGTIVPEMGCDQSVTPRRSGNTPKRGLLLIRNAGAGMEATGKPANENEVGSKSDSQEWWKTFFTGVAVETWVRGTTAAQTRAEVDMLLRAMGNPGPSRVIDLPCGQGRHAVELACRGCEVTGVDLSAEFLVRARELARNRGVEVQWQHRDVRDLPWRSAFDGACCFGNSFGYMSDPQNNEFLAAVAKTLRPGGRFVMEAGAAVAEVVLPRFQERQWFELGDIVFLLHNRYDHSQSLLVTEFTFVKNGKVERRMGYQRVYGFRELSDCFRAAGFTDVEGVAGVGGEPFRLGAPRLLMVATRES